MISQGLKVQNKNIYKLVNNILPKPKGWFSTETTNVFDIRNMQKEGRSIYLDIGATTPLDFRVLDFMMPYLTYSFGNPHSRYVFD